MSTPKKLTKKQLEELTLKWEAQVKKVEELANTNNNLPKELSEKEKRVNRVLSGDYEFFATTYFSHYMIDGFGKSTKPAPFHIETATKIFNADYEQFLASINWSRGFAKSVVNSLIVPIWLMVCRKVQNVVVISKTLADATTLLLTIQSELMHNEKLIEDFGPFRTTGTWSKFKFIVKDECMFSSLGREQSPRGLRFRSKRIDLLIVDDCDDDEIVRSRDRIKEAWKWLMSSVINSCSPNFRFLFIENLYAKNSLCQRFQKLPKVYLSIVNALVKDENGEWVSNWKEVYSTEWLLERKEVIGHSAWESEFMNNPTASDGNIFKEEWIHYEEFDIKSFGTDQVITYIDPSYSEGGDYKAIITMGYKNNIFYVDDIFLTRCSIDDMYKYMYSLYEHYQNLNIQQTIFIESNFAQGLIISQIENISSEYNYELPIIYDKQQKINKSARIEGMSPYFQNNKVKFNKKLESKTDTTIFMEQLLGFEKTSSLNDDGPDCLQSCIAKTQLSFRTVDADTVLMDTRSGNSWNSSSGGNKYGWE